MAEDAEEEEGGGDAWGERGEAASRAEHAHPGIPAEVFHMSMKTCNGVSPTPAAEEPTFAGRRDVRDPRSLHEKQIVSAKGTVRGFKNRVRAGIVTFIDASSSSLKVRRTCYVAFWVQVIINRI